MAETDLSAERQTTDRDSADGTTPRSTPSGEGGTVTFIDVLPGAVVVAFVAPALANGGVSEWVAAIATVVVARRTGNLLLSLAAGVGTVLALRGVG